MTCEEAIKELGDMLKRLEYLEFNNNILQQDSAVRMAQAALDKQIPLNPYIVVNDRDIQIGFAKFQKGTKITKCSNCKEFVLPYMKYCCMCGQRLRKEE